jgi:hypothetical protein
MTSSIEKLTRNEVKNLLKKDNLLEFNRSIKPLHVKAMFESVKVCGILRLPVVGKLNYPDRRNKVVVDGQHLLSAFLKTKQPYINCVRKEYKDKNQVIRDVAKLNNIQKSWNDENYLDAWYKFGKTNLKYFTNYAYLYNMYKEVLTGLPCGLLIDIYAVSKNDFKEGKLEFKDREFSDKLAQVCYMLKTKYKKGAFTLQGLRVWAFRRKFKDNRDIDFTKLECRLKLALRNNEDKNCNSREDFESLVDIIYNRI